MTVLQLCTFDVGPLRVGIDVRRVQEVRRGEEVTPVPLAPDSVAGIVNLRGQILSVIDARRRFALDARDPASVAGGDRVHVVVESAGAAVSLEVDAERDVIDVDPSQIEPPPDTVSPAIAALISGVHKVEGALLLVLDPDRALSAS